MTASVGDLLGGAHALAWELSLTPPRSAEDRAGLVAAWPVLAKAALRAMDAVPGVPPPESAIVNGALRQVAAFRGFSVSAEPHVEVVAMAVRLGAVADLLVSEPQAASRAEQVAAEGLRADVLAAVHALAVVTLPVLAEVDVSSLGRGLLRQVATSSEPFALLSPGERAGRYQDVAAVAQSEGSLDAAISWWIQRTIPTLVSPQRVTGTVVQVAAGDAAVLTAAATTVCAAATQLGLIGAKPGGEAVQLLSASHASWRAAAAWPKTVRLDGVRDRQQTLASRQLRQLVADTLREDGGWLTPAVLADRTDVAALVATMRRGLHATSNVALAHYQAVENLVRGPGQVWMFASAVTQSAFRGYATVEAMLRKGWVVMPPWEPDGDALLRGAEQALATTTVARAGLDATASATAGEPGGRLRWEQGRIVAAGPVAPPPYETVTARTSRGVQEERRKPIPMGRPAQGPRR